MMMGSLYEIGGQKCQEVETSEKLFLFGGTTWNTNLKSRKIVHIEENV